MKKTITILFAIIAMAVSANAQCLTLVRNDSASYLNGAETILEWSDSGPITSNTRYQVIPSGWQSGFNVTGTNLHIQNTSFNNGGIWGWTCFNPKNVWTKTTSITIVKWDGTNAICSVVFQNIKVASNYIYLGCPSMSAVGVSQTSTGASATFDFVSPAIGYNLTYNINGGSNTNLHWDFPYYSWTLQPGDSLHFDVTQTCGAFTSKSGWYKMPPLTPTPLPVDSTQLRRNGRGNGNGGRH